MFDPLHPELPRVHDCYWWWKDQPSPAIPHRHADWDKYLSGVTPHESTGEKPSFLLFGIDCRGPTKAGLLLPNPIEPVELNDYREEVIRKLSSAHELALKVLQELQR